MGGVEKNLFADEFKKHKNQETTIGVWELMGCDEDEATRVSPCQGGDDELARSKLEDQKHDVFNHHLGLQVR